MAVLGPQSLVDIAVPTGVDAGQLFRFQMQSGLTAEEVIGLAATVIGQTNERLAARYGGLAVITTSRYARYRQGAASRSMTPTKTEFSESDPIRGEQIGHMLPRNDYTDAVGWSAEFLARADEALLGFDIEEISERWENRVDYDVITRMFSDTENAIGTAGYDVPWVKGAGSVQYVPPQYLGNSFTSAHNHFKRTNAAISTSNTVTALNDAAKELSEHGHIGAKVALVSQADLANYTGMVSPKFAPLVPGPFRVVGGSSANTYTATVEGEVVGVPGETFGYFNSDYGVVELKMHPRIPTGYFWMGKSYGNNNSKNPLAICVEGSKGFGMMVRPQVSRDINPELESIQFRATHGVGVNDRVNGVAYQIATGGTTYSAPTIS